MVYLSLEDGLEFSRTSLFFFGLQGGQYQILQSHAELASHHMLSHGHGSAAIPCIPESWPRLPEIIKLVENPMRLKKILKGACFTGFISEDLRIYSCEGWTK